METKKRPYYVVKSKTNISDIYAVVDNQFVGMLCTVYHQDIVFLWYLAVEEKLRNQGYGSLILKEVKQQFGVDLHREVRIIGEDKR